MLRQYRLQRLPQVQIVSFLTPTLKRASSKLQSEPLRLPLWPTLLPTSCCTSFTIISKGDECRILERKNKSVAITVPFRQRTTLDAVETRMCMRTTASTSAPSAVYVKR